jgi:hypothetical protein
LLDATNATDLDAFLAADVDGDVVDDRGCRFVGAAVIRSWSIVNSSASGVNLEVGGVETRTVTAGVGGAGSTA